MRWIVVTGCNGFIGHNLVLEFLEKSIQTLDFQVEYILGCDLAKSLNRSTHIKSSQYSNYEFCLASELENKMGVLAREFGTHPIAVIHNGACSSTTETDPEVFRTLNVEASQSLFRYCTKRSIPYLYASSASVYGDGKLGFSDALEKNDSFSPLNLYGQSKHRFDSWVLEQESTPPSWFGLRYFNVFGPHEEHKLGQASIFHWGRKQIEENSVLRLFRAHRDNIEDGAQQRDFVSSYDVVRVTLELLTLALKSPGLGRFVNIGRGQATTWLEIGSALFAALEKEPKFEFIDMPAPLQEHYQNYTQADHATLKELGISCDFLSHEDAFRRALRANHRI